MADEMMVKELEEVVVRFSGDSATVCSWPATSSRTCRLRLEMTSVHFPIIRQISVLRKGR